LPDLSKVSHVDGAIAIVDSWRRVAAVTNKSGTSARWNNPVNLAFQRFEINCSQSESEVLAIGIHGQLQKGSSERTPVN
jgi:hypothetical protein